VNFRARCLGDPRGGNPVVHDAPVVHHDRRGRWRLVKDVAGMRRRQNMPIQVAGVEVGCFHKGEGADAQAKTKAAADGAAPIGKPVSVGERGSGRQRRPAAVGCRVPPGYPGWPPNRVRRPAPPHAVVPEPAAVMEGRPTPGVIREPVPPAIAVDPAPAITVRTPARVGDDHGRPPARAPAGDVYPGAIRRQGIVKNRVADRLGGRRRRGGRGFRHGGGLGRLRRVQLRFLRDRRGWGRLDAGRAAAERLIPLNHGGHNLARDADVVHIDNLIGAQVEGSTRVGDEGQQHAFLRA